MITWTYELSFCGWGNYVWIQTPSFAAYHLAYFDFWMFHRKPQQEQFKPSVWRNSMQSLIKHTWALVGQYPEEHIHLDVSSVQSYQQSWTPKFPWQGYQQILVQQMHSQPCQHTVLFWDPILNLCVKPLHQQLTQYQTYMVQYNHLSNELDGI